VIPRTNLQRDSQRNRIFWNEPASPEHALTPRQDTPAKPTDWISGNLVSLGSVAVFAVYAAGYARTAEAARRYENEDRQRRETVRTPVVADAVMPPAHPMEATTPVEQKAPTQPPKDSAVSPKHAAKRETAPATPAKADTTPSAKTDTVVTALPVAAAPPPSTVAPQPSSDTTLSADTKRWKDGSYTGWGGSRHGDIQATVEIKDGKISAAWISICATQYSCSWLDALPGQVVARQSPEVDFVSGATQSTNAFYYAVVQALRKAK
jgi:uncharacterized protein with FMN-binding domain